MSVIIANLKRNKLLSFYAFPHATYLLNTQFIHIASLITNVVPTHFTGQTCKANIQKYKVPSVQLCKQIPAVCVGRITKKNIFSGSRMDINNEKFMEHKVLSHLQIM